MKPTRAWEEAVKSCPDEYTILTKVRRSLHNVNGQTFPRELVAGRSLIGPEGNVIYSEAILPSEPIPA